LDWFGPVNQCERLALANSAEQFRAIDLATSASFAHSPTAAVREIPGILSLEA